MRQIAVIFCLLLSFSSDLHADSPLQLSYTIDIPAMERRLALIELATQLGLEIIFEPGAKLEGRALGLQGSFDLSSALEVLLRDQNLGYNLVGTQIRVFSLIGSKTLPKITVLGYLRHSNPTVSENDDAQEQFPLYQLPLSIQSVSDDFMDDVVARSVEDSISYVAGIEFFESTGGVLPTYYSRGISTPGSVDGKFYRRVSAELDPAILERIDVVQGPSANYLDAGGMINFVVKKPKEKTKKQLSFLGGSYDFFRAEIDVNVSSESEEYRALRLVAAYHTEKNIKDYVGTEKRMFSPSLSVALSRESRLTLSGYYRSLKSTPGDFTFQDSFVSAPIPRRNFIGAPWSHVNIDDYAFSADISTDDFLGWTLAAGANLNGVKTFIDAGVANLPDESGRVNISHAYADSNTTNTNGFDISMEKPSGFWGVNTLSRFGFEYQYWDITELFFNGDLSLGLLDIYSPDYSVIERPSVPEKIGGFDLLGDFFGLSFSQYIYFSNDVALFMDLRYENMIQDLDIYAGEIPLLNTTSLDWRFDWRYQEITPQIGLNMPLWGSLSGHLRFSESFSTQAIPIADDFPGFGGETNWKADLVGPLENRQLELAFKKKWRDEALATTLTFYRLERSNVQTFYFKTEILDFVNEPVDDEFSEGVIFNMTGKLGQNLNIVSNFSYNDNAVSVKPGPPLIGVLSIIEPRDNNDNRHRNTAKNIANLWLNYRPLKGKAEPFEFGLGVKYVSDRYGDDDNTYILPAYTKIDTVLTYTGVPDVDISLSVRNVFDQFYYAGAMPKFGGVEEGEPRSIYLSLKMMF